MPTLNWIGKEAVVNHDKEVPFKLLRKVKSASVGKNSQNLIMHGDNLEALKALMPFYVGKIKCIYIDPPYNTGKEKWIYNDKVNSPKIKQWLGKIVGPASEDLTSHDKWLCMMFPRLKLLKDLLSEDGVIFISVDENEEHHLRLVLDEIFGAQNFIEKIIWNKRIPKNDKGIGNIHEYILLYAKDNSYKHKFKMPKEGLDDVYAFVAEQKRKEIPIPEAEKNLKQFYNKKGYDRGITLYCNLDDDYKIWGKINVSWPNSNKGPRYDILHPLTNQPTKVPDNGWRYKRETFDEFLKCRSPIIRYDGSVKCGKIWFAKDEKTQPSYIQFLDDVKNFLFRSIMSVKSSGNEELSEYIKGRVFPHPKTYNLIQQLIESVEGDDFIVLDSFAGSGTTAEAVIRININGGNRKFILVEMEDKIAKDITAERVKRAIEKYDCKDGFEYCELDKPLFNEHGNIEGSCDFNQFATYIYFTETQTNIDKKKIKGNLVGEYNNVDYYLIYKGKNKNVLDKDFLKKIKKSDNKKIIYADWCSIDDDILEKYNIEFKQIPYEVKVY
jgi:adenine-specific DNA-methyltransferase